MATPGSMKETVIRMAVIHSIPWIRKKQINFAKQARQSNRTIVSRETHYLWDIRYQLEVVELDANQSLLRSVKVKGGKFILTVSIETSTADKLKTLNEYYRARLKSRAPDLISKWSEQIDVTASG